MCVASERPRLQSIDINIGLVHDNFAEIGIIAIGETQHLERVKEESFAQRDIGNQRGARMLRTAALAKV